MPAVAERTFAAATDIRVTRETAAVVALLVLAAIVRLWNIDSIPSELHPDEMAGFTGVRDVLAGKLPAIAFFDYRVIYLPLMGVCQFLSVALFGNTITALRLPGALLGVVTTAAMGLLAYQLTKNRVAAYVAAFAMAILPWDVNLSRVGWEGATTFPCLLLGLYFVRRGLDDDRRRDLRWGFGLLALGAYSYRAEIVDAVVLTGALLAFDWRRTARNARGLAEATGVALAVGAPLLLSLAFHHEFFEHDHAGWTFENGVTFDSIEIFINLFLMHFSWVALFVHGDGNLQHGPEHGMLYWWMLPAIVCGCWYALRELEPRTRWFLIVWILLFPVGGSLTDEGRPHYLRTLIGAPLFCLLAGMGAIVVWRFLARRPARVRRVAEIAAAAVVVLEFSLYCRAYFVDYRETSAKIFQYGDREIFAIVRAHLPEYDRVCFAALDGWNYTAIIAYYFPDAPIPAFEGMPDDCKKPRSLLVVDPTVDRSKATVVATVQNRDGTTRAVFLGR